MTDREERNDLSLARIQPAERAHGGLVLTRGENAPAIGLESLHERPFPIDQPAPERKRLFVRGLAFATARLVDSARGVSQRRRSRQAVP